MVGIKDMIGVTVGASLLAPVMGGIGGAFSGSLSGLGSATQTIVGGGFAANVAGKFLK